MMSAQRLGLIALVGVLLTVTALYVAEVALSQTPDLPIADLLLQESDFPDCGFGCERDKQDVEALGREMAEFVGLPLDYQEGGSVYFLVHSSPEPKAVVHGVYRYGSQNEAIAHYEHLLEALPLAPLGRRTPIASRSEWFSEGVQGQIIEAQDPIGTAYWFVSVRGKVLMVLVVLGTESMGRPVFHELLPIALERMIGRR